MSPADKKAAALAAFAHAHTERVQFTEAFGYLWKSWYTAAAMKAVSERYDELLAAEKRAKRRLRAAFKD